jgi:3-dehydroquinate synthase
MNHLIILKKIASLIKKEIIEYDEFENFERKSLNYGHTIGHALESMSNYFIPHGIAILIGMYIKNELFYDNKYIKLF